VSAAAAPKPAMHYGRLISEPLLGALAAGGPLHSVMAWRQEDLVLRDVQLRHEPKGPASWVSLYLGLTSILDIVERAGEFRLRAHPTHRARGQFGDSWDSWQSLGVLTQRWPKVQDYLSRIVHEVDHRWLDSEGKVHALLAASANTGFSVINREASISFSNQPTKKKLVDGWTKAVGQALDTGDTSPWLTALRAKKLGTSPDFLAVDDAGRLLVIEAKPATAAAGIVGAPAQVGLYAAMYAAWLDQVGDAGTAELTAELVQRRRLGLVPGLAERFLAARPQVVPVLAIGPGVVSPEVWERVRSVAQALSSSALSQGVAPLEVLRLTVDGTPTPVDLQAAALSQPAVTSDDLAISSYSQRARSAAVAWKLGLEPPEARADGAYGGTGVRYPFCLP